MVISRLEKTKSILNDARLLCDKLDMVIVEDGVIDDDEVALINVIRKNINEYDKLLEEILEDGEVDDAEVHQMRKFEQSITEAVQKQTAEDGIISHGEQEMINLLFDCLKSLNTLGSF